MELLMVETDTYTRVRANRQYSNSMSQIQFGEMQAYKFDSSSHYSEKLLPLSTSYDIYNQAVSSFDIPQASLIKSAALSATM